MKELVEFLACSLVDEPKDVRISEKGTPENLALSLMVRREDLGKVIGKKGRTAKAMRALLMSVSARQNRRVSLEIVEPEPSGVARVESEKEKHDELVAVAS